MNKHAPVAKPLGFWSSWALTVGCMIGSGVFTLPAVLAPYGLLSFGGWLVSGVGSIALALTFARLASRTTRSGGPYVYAQESFGNLTGFLIAWGYWCSYVISIPAVALAFAGYLPVFFPALSNDPVGEAMCALALIWTLAAVNIRGLRDAGFLQIAMTALKIVPLVVIAGLGVAAGSWDNLPALAPQQNSPLPAIAACALLTLWAFTGFEAGVMPAGAVKDAERVIPRAIVIGMITVTLIYLTASFAVMLLVHPSELARSTAPFAEAARALGGWGPKLVAAGALLATAGALNGIIFVSGQAPMAAALDKLAPNVLGRTNAGGAPYVALLISVALGSALLLLNTSRGTIGAFQFLIMMSTGTILIPYLVSALAELRHSLDRAKSAALAAVIGGYFALFALIGSGWEVLAWGGVLLAIGLPLYILGRDLRR